MTWRGALAIGLTIGAAIGILMCFIAIDHNPQGEFADPETGAWTGNLVELFAVYTAMVGLPIAALLALLGYLSRPRN